jgi:Epoxide hydrolase N terminus
MTPRPFAIRVPDGVLSDLRARLDRVRWPDQVPDAAWRYGTSLAYMQELVAYWRDRYDWRAQEAELNRFTQFIVAVGGIDLHFIHQAGVGPAPFPLLLSHGWPGSIVEFRQLIPMLTDPVRFGADPADAFTVIAPSLPGYAFSFQPNQPRFGVVEIADLFASLMTDVLGYRRFGAQGGVHRAIDLGVNFFDTAGRRRRRPSRARPRPGAGPRDLACPRPPHAPARHPRR